jgi:AcrR family transcriptional regulator
VANLDTVGEVTDRRARKKAQTRAQIRSVARELFAEHGFDSVTIADIAARADVAVQTVFNHFPAKEELFFDGRADWVEAPAEAVRARAPGVPPLTALREHLMESLRGYLRALADPAHRCVVATLEASPALSAYERELHHRSVRALSHALVEAYADAEQPGDGSGVHPRISASLTAAIWMAAIQALVVEQRRELSRVAAPDEMSAAVELLATEVFEKFEGTLGMVQGASVPVAPLPQVTGRPAGVRRAG